MRAFLTELKTDRSQLRGIVEQPSNADNNKDNPELRSTEPAQPVHEQSSGSAAVFEHIDKLGERQKHSRNIRGLIQKAAQKTILVVRTKNATQAAENVSIRFHQHQMTDVPRAVQLRYLCEKVLDHTFAHQTKKSLQHQQIFKKAPEIENMIKDMFWYIVAHFYQNGRHATVEESFYQRIADNFTSLFIRLQVQPETRDSGFFDVLPDVLAQVLFMALYEAFPRTRKSMMNSSIRRKILELCHCWMLGYVPTELSWAHWLPVDQESPKRIAALAEFPAMRNRMLRAERVERTKLDVRNRHASSLDLDEPDTSLDLQRESALGNGDIDQSVRLPVLPKRGSARGLPQRQESKGASELASTNAVEIRERYAYRMSNSPLVAAFLKRHQLDANAAHLGVQLHMTSGVQFDLRGQEALEPVSLPVHRRRRLMSTREYAQTLDDIERFGDSLRHNYASEKQRVRERDLAEKRRLVLNQRELEAQFGELRHSGERIHALSNLLASRVGGAHRPGAELQAVVPHAPHRPIPPSRPPQQHRQRPRCAGPR